jgi:hypothetical protein
LFSAVTFTGSVTKQTRRALASALTFAGDVTWKTVFVGGQAVGPLIGSIVKRAFGGTVTPKDTITGTIRGSDTDGKFK